MKGLCILGRNKIGWKDLPKPEVGPNDALVKPTALCPCTSDVHIVETLPETYTKIVGKVFGHEGIGVVVEVGANVQRIKVGDRVAGFGMCLDWRSPEAQRGFAQLDPKTLYEDRMVQFGGTYQEFMYSYEADANLSIIPDNVTDKQAVLISDMMGTAFTQTEVANINYGDTVAVYGIGPVGLMSIAAAKLKGAARIIAIGSRPCGVELAKFYGATDIVNYKDGPVDEQIIKLTKGEKCESVLMSGPPGPAINEVMNFTRPGGTISNVGIWWDEAETVISNASWGFGCLNQFNITGTYVKSGRVWTDRLLNLVSYGRVDPGPLATQEYYGFEKIEEAYYRMSVKSDDMLKPVVYCNDL